MDDSQLKTRSHVLATTGVINKAATSRGRAGELCDLGWNNNTDVDQHPWITGVDNEDVWVLMRRMDKASLSLSPYLIWIKLTSK